MNRTKFRTSSLMTSFRLQLLIGVAAAFAFAFVSLLSSFTSGQTLAAEGSTNGVRVGERLTYNVSIGRYRDAAYAELYAVSRGRLADKDAIELRAKFKTLDLASAALYLIDETRTTFMSPSTGLALHSSIIQNTGGLPKETNYSFLSAPTLHADLLTMIYKIRHMGGTGSLTMQENEKLYPVTFQAGAAEKQKTDAGEFETTAVSVQSDYFTEQGINDFRINLSTDEAKLPVLIRFRTTKGLFKIGLASVQMIEPEVVAQPTPVAVRTPLPERTPKPVPTPAPYVDNLPLPAELAFELGESLEYRIVSNGQPIARMTLLARERKQFQGIDSLLLEAIFSDIRPGGPFVAGDFIRAYVDPETLAPRQVELRFAGPLQAFSNTARFEQEGSRITFGGSNRVDAPVGTHSILSLLYAARSFNLKPSLNLNNPINDTRVAVFWESEAFIFTLRPSQPEVLTLDGKPFAGQLVSVSTKNAILDRLNIKIWLGNDESRIPVRFIVGPYQADLVSATRIQTK